MKKIWKHRYQVREKIGKGGNGQVYRVWDLHLEKEWAMKILEEKYTAVSQENPECEGINELQVLKRISHPHFPRIVDAFEEDQKKVLIMDLVCGITLEQILQKGALEEKKIFILAGQIADALLYLHQQNPVLLYMDLKPSNIMIEENGNVKLVDFGSVIIKGSQGRISGSFGFASPEQVKIRQGGSRLAEQSDIFSFGMVLYAMAVGNCQRIPVIDGKSRYGVLLHREQVGISEVMERIVEKCTRGEPKRRYSGMREVKRELENGKKILEGKKRRYLKIPMRRRKGELWYQEKSIFCTEGKHSIYIAKKIMAVFLGMTLLFSVRQGPTIVKAWENENSEKEINREPQEETYKEEKEMLRREQVQEEELKIIVRDSQYRKVLVKDGCVYETDDNILLEIPKEEIQNGKKQIMVECREKNGNVKIFCMEAAVSLR